MSEVYANLGWIGMTALKPTPIWDARGRGEGVPRSVDRVIARDRKGKTFTADNTDQPMAGMHSRRESIRS
jgi:hypothetical protein